MHLWQFLLGGGGSILGAGGGLSASYTGSFSSYFLKLIYYLIDDLFFYFCNFKVLVSSGFFTLLVLLLFDNYISYQY